MLKVLHYIPGFLYGGIETMFLSWYRCIENKNVEFELLIRTQDDDATALKEYRNQNGKYYRLPTFSVKRVFDFKNKSISFLKLIMTMIFYMLMKLTRLFYQARKNMG